MDDIFHNYLSNSTISHETFPDYINQMTMSHVISQMSDIDF